MDLFLSNFINTLTGRRQERVALLLEEAKVGKDQVNAITQRLLSFQGFSQLALTRENKGAKISGKNIALNFRDIDVQVSELYRMSNLVSNLINSDVALMSAQVKALEDEIIALDKLAENYGFLLAEGGAYNYAYLEPFSDETGRDSFDFSIPDRASQVFGPAEQAEVRYDEGVLALSEGALITSPISGTIIDANASAYVVTNNGIENATSRTAARGWRYIVGSPNPVTSSMTDALGRGGAQVLIEFILHTPGPASEIKIVPFSEHPIEIVRVVGFEEVLATDGGFDLLTEPVLVDRPFTVHFPTRSCAKFRVLINQPVYERTAQIADVGEESYRTIWEQYRNKRESDPRYQFLESVFKSEDSYNRLTAFLRIVNYIRSVRGETIFSIPDRTYDADWGPMRLDSILTEMQRDGNGSLDMWFPINSASQWVNRYAASDPGGLHVLPYPWPGTGGTGFDQNQVPPNSVNQPDSLVTVGNTTVNRFADSTIPSIITNVFRDIDAWRPFFETKVPLDELDVPPSIFTSPGALLQPSVSFEYNYYLGLEYIGIGMTAPGRKGVFVSQPYSCNGDIGEMRMKVSDQNFFINTNRDNNQLTSVEYSVSNVSSPNKESDWLPILPIDSEDIEAERLFPDATGVAFLRFSADRALPVVVYRNGVRVPIDNNLLITTADGQQVTGLKLPLGEVAVTDIFTASYTPSHDFTIVNFVDSGFGDLPLVTAHDSDGAGEGFVSAGGRNIIDLAHEPFVDEDQVQANLTNKVSTYQPITILLSDGTVAQNVTNYGPGAQSTLPAPPTIIPVYIHSGKSIIFNDVISQSFRVYYQFLQNNVRTRVVLRVNDLSFVSPTVDYVHVKAKTRRANRVKAL